MMTAELTDAGFFQSKAKLSDLTKCRSQVLDCGRSAQRIVPKFSGLMIA